MSTVIIEVKMHNTDSFKFKVANLVAPGVSDVESFIAAYEIADTTKPFAEVVSTVNTTALNKAQISSIAIYA